MRVGLKVKLFLEKKYLLVISNIEKISFKNIIFKKILFQKEEHHIEAGRIIEGKKESVG